MFERGLERRPANAPLAQRPADPTTAAQKGLAAPSTELPHRSALERSFGHDLSAVSCHSGAAADSACAELGADAFTFGGSIVLSDKRDLRTVAEETTHALQQSPHDFGFLRQQSGGITDPQGRAEHEATSIAASVSAGSHAGPVTMGLGPDVVARASSQQKASKQWDKLDDESKASYRAQADALKEQLRQEIYAEQDISKTGRSGGAINAQVNKRLGEACKRKANELQGSNPMLAHALRISGGVSGSSGKSGVHK